MNEATADTKWRAVKHSWSDTSIYEGDRRVCLLSIRDEATEDNQDRMEQQMARDARQIESVHDLYAACKAASAALLALGAHDCRAMQICQSALARATG